MIAKLATGDAHKNFLCSSTLVKGKFQEPRTKIQILWALEFGTWDLLRFSEVLGP
jgi:hypothetical protein